MILSICMMVKNEEMNLKRCLDSLEIVMSAVTSELIIVDTGSTDKTLEIAKLYTDKIFHHTWNNNFSEMRNITIDYATGEWIFIIDADEELVNPEAMITFLKSNNMKNNGAALKLDNIVNSKGDFGSSVTTIRIFRNNGIFKYSGTVHNILNVSGNIVELKSSLIHYGYISDDQVLMDKKFERTRSLLVSELEQNPNNIYYQFQLATTYEMHKDMDLAKVHYEKSYKLINESAGNKGTYLYLWAPLAKILIYYKEYNRAIEIISEGLNIAPDHIDLYYFMGIAQSGLSNWENVIDNFRIYLDLLEKIETLSIRRNPAVQLYTLESKAECLNNLSQAYIVEKNWVGTKEISRKLLDESTESSVFFVNAINYFIKACVNLANLEDVIRLYIKYPERENNLDTILYSCIVNLKFEDEQNEMLFKELCKLPSQLGVVFIKLRGHLLKQEILNGQNQKDYIRLVSQLNEEAFYLAIVEKQNITQIILETIEKDLMKMISSVDEKYSDFQQIFSSYIDSIYSSDFYSINTMRVIYKYLMLSNISNDEGNKFFSNYIKVGLEYLKFKYSSGFLKMNNLSLYSNSEEQFLGIINKIENTGLETNDINNLIEIFPEWRSLILIWIETKLDQSSLNDQEVAKTTDDKNALKQELISNVKYLLKNGFINEAKQIVDEMVAIFGKDDPDLTDLFEKN